jgi:fluoride exporter
MILWIAIGGFLGAIARYRWGLWIGNRVRSPFPWHTWVINISGAFVLGLWLSATHATAYENAWQHVTHPFTTGFLGAYTTFSTFSVETVQLLKQKAGSTAVLYVISSVLLSLLALWLGFVWGC